MINIKDSGSRSGTLVISDEQVMPGSPLPKELTTEWLDEKFNSLGTQLKFDLVAVVDEVVRRRLGAIQQAKSRDEGWMSTEEAAQYMKRSVSWMIAQKDIPYCKGRPNLYRKAHLDAWLMQYRHYQPKVV